MRFSHLGFAWIVTGLLQFSAFASPPKDRVRVYERAETATADDFRLDSLRALGDIRDVAIYRTQPNYVLISISGSAPIDYVINCGSAAEAQATKRLILSGTLRSLHFTTTIRRNATASPNRVIIPLRIADQVFSGFENAYVYVRKPHGLPQLLPLATSDSENSNL